METLLEQLIQQVDQLFNEKKFREIIKILSDELLARYNSAVLYSWRARAHGRLHEAELTFTYAQKSIEIDPLLATGYFNRGIAWSVKKEYDKAINDFNEAIRLNPDNALAYGSRGISWAIKNELNRAINDFTEAIRLAPDSSIAYSNRGFVWNNMNEYDKAIIDCTEAIRLDPNDKNAYGNRGNAWYMKNEYNKAITDYNKTIQLGPNEESSYSNRGLAWFKKNNYDKAFSDFQEAIRLNPNYAFAYGNRGLAWFHKNEYDKAIIDLNEAIQLDQNYKSAYYTRGNSWLAKKEYIKAVEDFQRFIELTNDQNEYLSQVAFEKIQEINKKIENAWYDEIDSLKDEIKELLLFEKPCLTHYTSLSGARAMILENSLFRLSEGSFLNDTSEGRELFKYLSFLTSKQTNDETIAELFVERPFIGSFVADTKHNDLTLWRMYGKEAQAEAKGCALTIYKDHFIDNLKEKVNPAESKDGLQSHNEDQFTFYNVAYLSKDKFMIPGKSVKTQTQLNKLMSSLKNKINDLNVTQKITITKLLNSIAYLFKSSEYQYENEVRLVVQGVGFPKTIKDNPPKVFIELVDIVPSLNKITLGPKVERADEWAAAFNYHIKEQLRDRDDKVEIIISHLPFK